MAKVCILGGGSWGIGLSVVLHKNGHEVICMVCGSRRDSDASGEA